MERITRKTLLYRSGLGFHCINHAQGCSHGCRYPCYAYMMAHGYGRAGSPEEWSRPKLVENAEALLRKELGRMREKPEMVHLCLTTDPFMVGYPAVADMSLRLVAVLNAHGIAASLLTKGILPGGLADRDRFPSENVCGISLVSLDEGFRKRWEPGAAAYADRIGALRALHDRGCRTFVHIEPYPTPNIIAQDLVRILEAVGFVDSMYFGGWNYSRLSGGFPGRVEFYAEQAGIVERFCAARGIRPE